MMSPRSFAVAMLVLSLSVGPAKAARMARDKQSMAALKQMQVNQVGQLPSVPLSEQVLKADDWWAHDGTVAYYPPATSHTELGRNISEYYYAYGAQSAIPDDLATHRVGGRGRLHIFHLPQPSASVSRGVARTRGSSLSDLTALVKGSALMELPPYPGNLQGDIRGGDPFDAADLQKEKRVMQYLNTALYKKYFDEMVKPDSSLLKVSTRNWEEAAETREVNQFIINEFRKSDLEICYQQFESWPHQWNRYAGGKTVYNVVAMSKGTEQGSVTIGAHSDSMPPKSRFGPVAAPGAVDNGSGVASVLAMAEAFHKSGVKTKKTIYFVAFGGEEENLYGSDYFAASLIAGLAPNQYQRGARQVRATLDERCHPVGGIATGGVGKSYHSAIIMDMIGWRDRKNFRADTVTLETKQEYRMMMPPLYFSNVANNGQSLKLLHSFSPYGSDHESFLIRGLSAILTIDNDGNSEAYPCYHKSCDTYANVDVQLATEITRMNLGGALRLTGLV